MTESRRAKMVKEASGYESRRVDNSQSPRDPIDLWPEPRMVVQVLNHVLIDRFGFSDLAAAEFRN
jgi:hypothetical protein